MCATSERKILSPQEWLKEWINDGEGKAAGLPSSSRSESSAILMYSSYWNSYVEDPRLMLIPLEDHMVHRGDGVFEAMKIVQGKIYLLNEHLDRLEKSAQALDLNWPLNRKKVEEILREMIEIKKVQNAGLRIFLSRGLGSFSPNPYDSLQTHFHFVLLKSQPPSAQKYKIGVSLGRSEISVKGGGWAQIKSCNYLQNVMMKKEAVDRGLDFTLAFDPKGYLAESSTENVILLDSKNFLCRPLPQYILKGTSMMRAFLLAEKLVNEKIISGLSERQLKEEDLFQAREVMIVGTTWDVLPVVSYEGKKISDGQVGPVAKRLLQCLLEDQKLS